MGLSVAVTGPTGQIGTAAVLALESDPAVDRIVGMARRPFDPSSLGWTKTSYQQGDIGDPDAVAALIADADVVLHLAFVIMGSRKETRRVNLTGCRNVFQACAAGAAHGRPRRLVYTSSVAVYGYHSDNPVPLTEQVPPRGSAAHYYSAQKAACEAALAEATTGSQLQAFVLRPCIVAGPGARLLAEAMPWNQVPYLAGATRMLPILKPLIPDPGTPLQLVHPTDVATAIACAVTTAAPPGAYNIAGDGVVSTSRVIAALGGRPVRIPAAAATFAAAAIAWLPFVPSFVEWLQTLRTPLVMDTTKAKTQLGWTPRYTAAQALQALTASL
ncbi:NAD-dependent epimerase/dehydratase family protein [Mycobacterium branderi]|uniref:Epimerase n=1 Tax=Mycobacterium branderi TaxID=43348 RepID=A0A7I7W722_9MYCO|nr:NAD-dependent epimerase/dehydratase family protein [Mycobacterium branderi]MCV7231138.1 NAD-dependent epimerase/dehydratase family protein [Mycobacterium branderi]ORA35713.1 epimerase [Mycobacterium branderi]BBZ12757.1 NAD-dependent epimerase [Mycobacterium branderi]